DSAEQVKKDHANTEKKKAKKLRDVALGGMVPKNTLSLEDDDDDDTSSDPPAKKRRVSRIGALTELFTNYIEMKEAKRQADRDVRLRQLALDEKRVENEAKRLEMEQKRNEMEQKMNEPP
ncbi:hypothetical protein HDV05_006535, partial [Chytridiales sp. JEL 0842]